ncbi:MAG: MlaD family protein [Pseudomonadota bacterium]
METRSNIIAIGVFVMTILGGAMGMLYWLATAGDAVEETEMIILFEGAVTGLTKSAAVYFNGIKVGNVTRIEFSKDDPTQVITYATVDATAPLKTDTTAELGFQGLTGVAHIELKGGTRGGADLFSEGGTPTIIANPSAFQDILETARTVMTKADITLGEINKFLEGNRETVTATLSNVEQFSKALADNSDNISTFLADISVAGKSFASLSTRLEEVVDRINPILAAVEPETVSAILSDASTLTKQLADASGKIDTIIANAEAAAAEVQTFAAGLNTSLKAVDGVIAAVDQEKLANTIDGLEALAGAFKDRKDDVSAMIVDARDTARNVSTITGKIAERADDIDGMIADARSAVASADKLAQSLTTTAEEAGKVVAAIDPEAVGGTIDNVNKLTGRLAARTDDVDKIITDTTAAMGDARSAVANVKDITETVTARRQSVDKIITNVETATGQLPTITEDVRAALEQVRVLAEALEADRINRVVGNVETLTGRLAGRADDIDAIITGARNSTENVERLTGALAAKEPEVTAIVDEALALSKRLNATSVRINGLVDKVDGMLGDTETGGLISEARRAATSIANIAEAFESRASRISSGIDRLTSSGVSKFEDLLDTGRQALRQIERSVQSIEQNPQSILFGGPQVRRLNGNRR